MAVTSDKNTSVKEYDKIGKYKALEIQTENIWHTKTTIMPLITGALDTINKIVIKNIKRSLIIHVSVEVLI